MATTFGYDQLIEPTPETRTVLSAIDPEVCAPHQAPIPHTYDTPPVDETAIELERLTAFKRVLEIFGDDNEGENAMNQAHKNPKHAIQTSGIALRYPDSSDDENVKRLIEGLEYKAAVRKDIAVTKLFAVYGLREAIGSGELTRTQAETKAEDYYGDLAGMYKGISKTDSRKEALKATTAKIKDLS